jgi:hypothetical protein
MLYAAAAFLTALTFALLAYAADREKHYTFADRTSFILRDSLLSPTLDAARAATF